MLRVGHTGETKAFDGEPRRQRGGGFAIVLGLSTEEIARAFILSEPTIAQRLVRAKRKIAEAGIPFEVPGRHARDERLDAVLSSLEIAYAKAHEDARGAGPHATFADEMLRLTQLLSELLPHEPDVLALAATVHYAEARRRARVDDAGRMVPLTEQDPTRWSHALIREAESYLKRAARLERPCARELEAAIHGAWCARASLPQPPPWSIVLSLYDMLAVFRADPVVRINRAVAVAEVVGAERALAEIDALDRAEVNGFVRTMSSVRTCSVGSRERPKRAPHTQEPWSSACLAPSACGSKTASPLFRRLHRSCGQQPTLGLIQSAFRVVLTTTRTPRMHRGTLDHTRVERGYGAVVGEPRSRTFGPSCVVCLVVRGLACLRPEGHRMAHADLGPALGVFNMRRSEREASAGLPACPTEARACPCSEPAVAARGGRHGQWRRDHRLRDLLDGD